MHWILIQPHLTVRQIDILTVPQIFVYEVKHILGVKDQVADAVSPLPDSWRERCNLCALEVTAAAEWVADMTAGIIDDEQFGPIAGSLANPSSRPLPSTASPKEHKLWVAAQQFYLEENGLLWLRGDLEKTQIKKTARAKEKEEDGKADIRGWLCIPRSMQRWIRHEDNDTPAGGQFSADWTYLHMKDQYFWKQMWRDTQPSVAGCDLCHWTNHQSGEPMGLLEPLPKAKGHLQRIGIDFITELPISGNGHDCIVTFVNHVKKRGRWWACKKSIDATAFAGIFIDDIIRLYGLPQEVVSDCNVRLTAECRRYVAKSRQTNLLMSMAFHPDPKGLSENSNKTVVLSFCGFANHDQANWDDYLPLAGYASTPSIHGLTKQMSLELNLVYESPSPLDFIAELQRAQANESAKTLQGCKFVERLQRILGVGKDELRDRKDKQTAEADMSRRPIDPAISAGGKEFPGTKDVPMKYANVNPTRRKLVHRDIGP